ncbi:MAG: DNA repair and recombination protein RadA [Candidatus Diapherotrites archaeon]|nr:DNA repair and recombination protein RadA [Candidatus Diapherotrites archaeon]
MGKEAKTDTKVEIKAESKAETKSRPKTEEKRATMTIEDLPGIGPQAAEKLTNAGYKTVEAIAVASPDELIEVAGLGDGTAEKAIKAARDAMEMGFQSADKLAEKRLLVGKITTGSKEVDALIGGGIETQSITEVYGKFASGKSQWCFETAVTVQMPKDKGGLEGNCLYIDSENSFRPERVIAIAKHFKMDPQKVLKNIFVARAYNADHQMVLAEKAADLIKEKNVKLIIVDSLTAQFRAEFLGRGMLADRQQRLNKHMHTLMKIAEMQNVAVLVTNQVMQRPDILFGDPTAPIGGEIVAHASKTRLYLRKSKEDKRVAKLVDSPSLPDGEAIFRVTENGLEDVE